MFRRLRWFPVTLFLLAPPAEAQDRSLHMLKCSDPELDTLIANYRALDAEDGGHFFEVDADGFHVSPDFWEAIDLEHKQVLMIAASAVYNCIEMPRLFEAAWGRKSEDTGWFCQMPVYRSDATWEGEVPTRIAETLPGWNGRCEFKFHG